MTGITRRDFLNGVALTIAAGLTPAAQIAAQPAALSARADRAARPARRLVRGRARAGARARALRARRRCRSRSATIWSWSVPASAGLRPPGSTAAPPGRRRASSSSTITTISAAMPSATSSRSTAGSIIGYGGSEFDRFAANALQRRRQSACCASSGSRSRGSRPPSSARSIRRSACPAACSLPREAFGRDVLVAGEPRVGRSRRAHAPPGQRQAA